MGMFKCERHECFQNGINDPMVKVPFCQVLNSPPTAGTHNCPFCKTAGEVEKGRDEAHARLVALGRRDLIETYENNKDRRW